MAVYIKGMEMPTTCRECPLEQPYDGYNCAITGKSYSWALSGRPSDCPLVPVPPHGRLIDGEVLRQDWLENGENEYVYDTNAFLDSLDNAPTIIPAEEGE